MLFGSACVTETVACVPLLIGVTLRVGVRANAVVLVIRRTRSNPNFLNITKREGDVFMIDTV